MKFCWKVTLQHHLEDGAVDSVMVSMFPGIDASLAGAGRAHCCTWCYFDIIWPCKNHRNTGSSCHTFKSPSNLATEYCDNYDVTVTAFKEHSVCWYCQANKHSSQQSQPQRKAVVRKWELNVKCLVEFLRENEVTVKCLLTDEPRKKDPVRLGNWSMFDCRSWKNMFIESRLALGHWLSVRKCFSSWG